MNTNTTGSEDIIHLRVKAQDREELHFKIKVNTPLKKLMDKYADVPVSLADVALVRMTETMDDPQLLTTDADFRVYRRHGRQIVPIVFPR